MDAPDIDKEISDSDAAGHGPLTKYLRASAKIPGWLRGKEAKTMASVVSSLPDDCVVVEIGSFLGSSSILLAGALKLRGSGKLHCVDPFDASGDAFSVPIYKDLLDANEEKPLRQCFDENIHAAGLEDWVEVHQGRADEISRGWRLPIDLLFLDGDHSPQGARRAYESWFPMLKDGGTIAIHNSDPREYAKDHNGSRLLVLEEVHPLVYSDIRLVETTTFARKRATAESLPH
jgi:predicted O-methyltransferase YrrM